MDCKRAVAALFVLSLGWEWGAEGVGLPCKAKGQTCSALVSFVPQAETNVSAITALFQLNSYRQLLGANAWELSVGEKWSIPPGLTVKVPITCACSNGSGISQDGPIYTVLPDDTLSIIAGTIFGGLLTYPDIVTVNPKITDPDKIYAGDKYRIPLPCTCSNSSLHYSYVVQAGNTLQGIASQTGSVESVLKTINNITNSSLLAAGQLLDVPLKACSSNISKSSADRNLLVANGSYAITASNCLQCSCGPSDLDLYCTPAPLSASCSTMRCKNSNLMIGNITTQPTSSGCNVTECSYNGYVNKTFLTSLKTSPQSHCPGKHVLPALTTPSSMGLAPAPAPALSPSPSPSLSRSPSPSPSSSPAVSPGTSPSSSPLPGDIVPPPSNSPLSGSNGSQGSPPSGLLTPPSMAADSLNSFSLATMVVLWLPLLIHFSEW